MAGIRSILRMVPLLLVAATLCLQPTGVMAASQVKVVVNNVAITSGDIAKRAAFLKLQRAKGNLAQMAREQLVDEVLKRGEVARLQNSVSTTDVDASVARFAAGNKLTVAQLSKVLDGAGVGIEHFKQFVAIQMSWPRAVNARFGSGGAGKLSTEELVRRMQENGGRKPETTEYFLQQVIFVIPESKRKAITAKRQAEANASRPKFPGCETSKVFAATMHDVSIRSLGRFMAQELPADWKPLIEKAGEGATTGTRLTEKGVEYLAICKKRQVNDDAAAEIVFRSEDLGKRDATSEDPNSKKYLAELRAKAQIINK